MEGDRPGVGSPDRTVVGAATNTILFRTTLNRTFLLTIDCYSRVQTIYCSKALIIKRYYLTFKSQRPYL